MKQRGRNEKYPEEIKTWKLYDPVPEWLSDYASVKGVKEDGSIILDIRLADNDRGFEIMRAGDNQILIKTHSTSDIVCFGNGRFFSLNKKQLALLYYDE